jgi:Gram-negative bacterial TonB protein C-terminal/PilZ domain
METVRVPPLQTPGRRRVPRYAISVPVSVTVLRSGVPEGVPGRSVDVCEGGLCAVLAAELVPGELVGVEFRLPHLSLSVLAKAKVKYQDRLRCGMQFLGLSGEQQATIRYWAERTGQRRTLADVADMFSSERGLEADSFPTIQDDHVPRILPDIVALPELAPGLDSIAPKTGRRDRRMLLVGLLGLALGMTTMAWWHWQQGWQELESQLPGREERPAQAPVPVATEIVQRLLVHKVDPIAPVNSDGVRVRGTVILNAIISRDGAVSSLRAASGPETLVRPAMDAVRWWRFEPYRKNGEPVDVETTLAIDFQ